MVTNLRAAIIEEMAKSHGGGFHRDRERLSSLTDYAIAHRVPATPEVAMEEIRAMILEKLVYRPFPNEQRFILLTEAGMQKSSLNTSA